MVQCLFRPLNNHLAMERNRYVILSERSESKDPPPLKTYQGEWILRLRCATLRMTYLWCGALLGSGGDFGYGCLEGFAGGGTGASGAGEQTASEICFAGRIIKFT